jgi:hypothetical protein
MVNAGGSLRWVEEGPEMVNAGGKSLRWVEEGPEMVNAAGHRRCCHADVRKDLDQLTLAMVSSGDFLRSRRASLFR